MFPGLGQPASSNKLARFKHLNKSSTDLTEILKLVSSKDTTKYIFQNIKLYSNENKS